MKTVHYFSLAVAVAALAGCGKEAIPSNNDIYGNGGGSSGVTGATTMEVTEEMS